MASSTQNMVKVIEVTEARPTPPPTESSTELTLPLTLFDVQWLRLPPVERLYFYKLTESTSSPSNFNSVTLPRLKHSLSLALHHYLPLCGRLTWPPHAPAPEIRYAPHDAACSVALTVAESMADFEQVSGDKPRDSRESFGYVPELIASDDVASILAIQITLFPYRGFSIGYSINHSILDGKEITTFMKAWAHICMKLDESLTLQEREHKHEYSVLPEELTPRFDRSWVKDPRGLRDVQLKLWQDMVEEVFPGFYNTIENRRSVKLLPRLLKFDFIRVTFELTREDLNRIKKMALTQLSSTTINSPPPLLSSFILTCAYVLVCMVKARGGDQTREVLFFYSVDCRARLMTEVPVNYFGNCICPQIMTLQAKDFMQQNGLSFIVEKMSEMIKGLEDEDNLYHYLDKTLPLLKNIMKDVQVLSVAGSNRFGVYELNFGWGGPRKVEITSIGRTGAFSLAESRSGGGGVEVGVALPSREVEVFTSLFVTGLKGFE